MKPHRIKMTHSLIEAYDLLPKLNVMVSPSPPTRTVIPQANKTHSTLNTLQHLHEYFLFIAAGRTKQRPIPATPEQMTKFHSDEYIHFLKRVTPDTAAELTENGSKCTCPPSPD
jgi:histone deacetylase 1/2